MDAESRRGDIRDVDSSAMAGRKKRVSPPALARLTARDLRDGLTHNVTERGARCCGADVMSSARRSKRPSRHGESTSAGVAVPLAEAPPASGCQDPVVSEETLWSNEGVFCVRLDAPVPRRIRFMFLVSQLFELSHATNELKERACMGLLQNA